MNTLILIYENIFFYPKSFFFLLSEIKAFSWAPPKYFGP